MIDTFTSTFQIRTRVTAPSCRGRTWQGQEVLEQDWTPRLVSSALFDTLQEPDTGTGSKITTLSQPLPAPFPHYPKFCFVRISVISVTAFQTGAGKRLSTLFTQLSSKSTALDDSNKYCGLTPRADMNHKVIAAHKRWQSPALSVHVEGNGISTVRALQEAQEEEGRLVFNC